MLRGPTGSYVTTTGVGGELVKAFLPNPLPPTPPIEITAALRQALDDAHVAIGRLDSVTTLLPHKRLFLYSYIRKEAVLSSQIEGTQSSLSDLLAHESSGTPGVPLDDVIEVSNYVAALEHGTKRIRDGFPLSSRLLRETHELLMRKGRGSDKQPGEYRRSQNWIGGTRPGNAAFVPPPHTHVGECISSLEHFLHDQPERTPTLIKAALAHAQFETIHPFLDGNGRVGRLLITLILSAEGLLAEPLLYLSLYLKEHRATYYELLSTVRRDGNWEAWLAFFVEGVRQTAEGAVATARRIAEQFQTDRAHISGVGRSAGTLTRLHTALQERPVASAAVLAARSGLSVPSVNTNLKILETMGIVREITGRQRDRLFSYVAYVRILSEGTEPLAV